MSKEPNHHKVFEMLEKEILELKLEIEALKKYSSIVTNITQVPDAYQVKDDKGEKL